MTGIATIEKSQYRRQIKFHKLLLFDGLGAEDSRYLYFTKKQFSFTKLLELIPSFNEMRS